jgi:PAS domain S-box-containing protein
VSTQIKILMIDDDLVTRKVAMGQLQQDFPGLHFRDVGTLEEFRSALPEDEFDVIITDFQLPDGNGIEILRHVRRNMPDLPVIMFTGTGSEEIAVRAMRSGLNDYVLKRPGSGRLSASVKSVLQAARDREDLEREKARYQVLFNQVPVGLYRCDNTGKFVQANQRMAELHGFEESEAFLDQEFKLANDLRAALDVEGIVESFETSLLQKDGDRLWLRHSAQVVRTSSGTTLHYEGAAEDISEKKTAEQKQEGLVNALRSIVHAANEISACKDLEGLYKSAAEFAHRFIGLERCAIFIEDGAVMRGTYGIRTDGEILNLKEVSFGKPEGTTERFGLAVEEDVHWTLLRNPLLDWDNEFQNDAPRNWLAITSITPLQSGQRSKGVFLSDALSGAEPDSTKQAILSIFCSLLGDIIELKETAEALRQSEALFRTLSENSPVGIWHFTPDGLTTYLNPVMSEMLEIEDANEIKGHRYHSFFAEKAPPRLVDRRSSDSGARELEIIGKNGGRKTVVTAGAPYFTPEGALHSMIRIFVDVTEQSEIERQLKNVVDSVPLVLYATDPDGTITFSEGKGLESLGLKPGEAVGQSIQEMYSDYPDVLRQFDRAVQGEEFSFTSEVQGVHWEGRYWPVFDGDGSVKSLIGVALNVSDRARLEKEVLDISAEAQRRIGNDLHDNLGQQLTGISFRAKALSQRLKALHLSEAEDAQQISELVNQAIDQTRKLARDLIPVHLESTGFIDALRDLCENAESLFDVACTLETELEFVLKEHATATHLYRIAQESINNAVRHGRAKQIVLTLRANGDLITMSIEDDGAGFPDDRDGEDGLGLNIMRYRADMIGATIEFSDRPGAGTRVACSFRI